MRPLILVVILLGLGYGGLQVLSQYQRQQAGRITDGLTPIPVTAVAAQSFDEKLSAMQKAAEDARRTGRTTPIEVTFTEQEITSKLAEMTLTGAGGFTATGMQIHFAGGNVVATSKVNVQGLDLSVGIVATPLVESGQAKLVIKDIHTGGIPIPDALKQQIQTQLGQAIDPGSLGLPLDVSKVLILDGKVVISGTAKP